MGFENLISHNYATWKVNMEEKLTGLDLLIHVNGNAIKLADDVDSQIQIGWIEN